MHRKELTAEEKTATLCRLTNLLGLPIRQGKGRGKSNLYIYTPERFAAALAGIINDEAVKSHYSEIAEISRDDRPYIRRVTINLKELLTPNHRHFVGSPMEMVENIGHRYQSHLKHAILERTRRSTNQISVAFLNEHHPEIETRMR